MELHNKTTEELTRLLAQERVKLQDFRFAMAGSKTKNVKEGKAVRKDIARICTEIVKRNAESHSVSKDKKS